MSYRLKKRTRTVKNALVDIDSVSVPPGTNYCNWITVTKQQLKEREFTFLKIKVNKIEFIVNDECKIQNFAIQKNVIDHTMKMLSNKIDQWQGVSDKSTKSPLSIYAHYFRMGKKWWDLHKRIMYGNIFWLSVFQSVEQFVNVDLKLLLTIISSNVAQDHNWSNHKYTIRNSCKSTTTYQ
eukprot:273420_1